MSSGRWVRWALVALAAILAAPAGARADTTLTFDDVAAGTTVTTQYQSRGVTFGPTSP